MRIGENFCPRMIGDMASSLDVRAAYLAAATQALDLIQHPQVRSRWDEPSVLSGMSIGALASHLARAILLVEGSLAAPLPQTRSFLDASQYYASFTGLFDPQSDINSGVRARSAELAEAGPDSLVTSLEAALGQIRPVLSGSANPVIAIAIRPDEVMVLDEYLRTRCVELAVHLEDLALSLAIEPSIPPQTVSIAVDVLLGAARSRHGDREVLHALARRERDGQNALCVL